MKTVTYNPDEWQLVPKGWRDEIQHLSAVAGAAMHQPPADMRNIMEDLADRLSAMLSAAPEHPGTEPDTNCENCLGTGAGYDETPCRFCGSRTEPDGEPVAWMQESTGCLISSMTYWQKTERQGYTPLYPATAWPHVREAVAQELASVRKLLVEQGFLPTEKMWMEHGGRRDTLTLEGEIIFNPSAIEIRKQALEEAAKLCDKYHTGQFHAERIRALAAEKLKP